MREEPYTARWTQGDAVWSLGRSRSSGVGVLIKNIKVKILRKV